MGTVFTSALPPAPGQPQRRAAPHRCVRRPVAFGYYVTRQSPPGQRVPAPGAPADSPLGREGLGSKSGCYAVLCKQASEATLAKFVLKSERTSALLLLLSAALALDPFFVFLAVGHGGAFGRGGLLL